jgi:integrase
MAMIKLTDGEVEALEPGPKDIYVRDSEIKRLYVRVTPAGAKVYFVQYRAAKAGTGATGPRKITIGQHDGEVWTVTKARAAAKKHLAAVDLGRDPFADREAERAAAAAARATAAEGEARKVRVAEERERDSFEAVSERYIDHRLKETRSGAETARLLRHGPVKAWTGRHIGEIRRVDVADLLDRIKKRSPSVARLTFAALRGLFGWAVERDLIVTSPCERLTAPPRPAARDRVLTDDELRAIWKASEGLGYPFGPIVKLLMLTGQRRAEVAGMAWTELDLDAATWRIPRERTKNAKAHEIDLSPQALAVLKPLRQDGPLLFPARNAPARTADPVRARPAALPVQGFSATKRRLDELVAAEGAHAPWRLHDLRRTAATGMAALEFAPHVVERVLNHISGAQGGLVGVYQRHDYRAERKAALIAWDARVAAIVAAADVPPEEGHEASPSNVVQLRASGHGRPPSAS